MIFTQPDVEECCLSSTHPHSSRKWYPATCRTSLPWQGQHSSSLTCLPWSCRQVPQVVMIIPNQLETKNKNTVKLSTIMYPKAKVLLAYFSTKLLKLSMSLVWQHSINVVSFKNMVLGMDLFYYIPVKEARSDKFLSFFPQIAFLNLVSAREPLG